MATSACQFPDGPVVASGEAARPAGWSSSPAEQQHGGLAQLKMDQDIVYVIRTLLSSSLALLVSRMIPAPSNGEKKVAKLCRRLQRMDNIQHEQASGRHEFLKGLTMLDDNCCYM